MKKILLLVEDNEDNRDLVCALLDDQYVVEDCKSAGEALDRLQSPNGTQPDLLLLDISLPGMDGVQLLHHIRGNSQLAHIPAVALTAHVMKDDDDRFMADGFEGYVTKLIVNGRSAVRSDSSIDSCMRREKA